MWITPPMDDNASIGGRSTQVMLVIPDGRRSAVNRVVIGQTFRLP